MLTDEEVELLRAWSQRVDVGHEFTLAGIKEEIGGGAAFFGTRVRRTVEARDGRLRFMRVFGYDEEGQPRKTKINHIRYVRVE